MCMNLHMIAAPAAPDDCATPELHPEAVAAARERLAAAPPPQRVAALFALLADPTRARILTALGEGELCVCDLAAATGVNRSTVSHQLRTLREGGVTSRRREGKVVYYALADDHVRALLEMGIAHAAEPLPDPADGEPALTRPRRADSR